MRPMASSPRIITRTFNKRHQPPELLTRRPISRFIVPPRAQASRRCETQATLRRHAAKAALAFRSLDPFRALREPDRRRRDEERPFPLRTKNWQRNPKNNRLTVLSSCEVCGVKLRPNGEIPSDLYGDIQQSSSDAGASQKRPLAVHRPSACSGVKALRNTSDAKRQSRQATLAFRSLDPFRALREPDRRRRDEERPFPLRTKNGEQNPKTTA